MEGRALHLHLSAPPGLPGPAPTLVFFHGGGWNVGTPEASAVHLEPWAERGWATANVSYRLAREAKAPAAVEDARHALAWVAAHAAAEGLDASRVVLSGFSSGGHLALMAAADGALRPAAVVSWFGISDVAALVEGPRPRPFARHWLGPGPDLVERARALSPLGRVRPGSPPVISIHGDADPVVPFDQSERLHQALDRAGVPNRLHVVPRGGHGDWDRETWERAYAAVFAFLDHVEKLPPYPVML